MSKTSHYNQFNTTDTPLSTKIHQDQVPNHDGAMVFKVDDKNKLRRFLILGSDRNFYSSAKSQTQDSGELIIKFAKNDYEYLINTCVDISRNALAPKNDPVLFAFAIAISHGSEKARAYAADNLYLVARTFDHLTKFVNMALSQRRWGASLRRAVGLWYVKKDAKQLAYVTTKYPSRNDWTHADLIRMAHPAMKGKNALAKKTWDSVVKEILGHSLTDEEVELLPEIIEAASNSHKMGMRHLIPDLIKTHGLTWEMLPTQALNNASTWESLITSGNLGMTAMIRQLRTMSRKGVFDDRNLEKIVIDTITDHEKLRKSGIHPMDILIAEREYKGGSSDPIYGYNKRSNLDYTPSPRITDALSDAFMASFENIEKSDKRVLHAVDVSASMDWEYVGKTKLTSREAAAGMMMGSLAANNNSDVVAFSHKLTPMNISARMRISDVLREFNNMNMGATNIGLAIEYALKKKISYDAFVIHTDNEVNTGRHVAKLLEEYRRKINPNAKMIVCAYALNDFSVADPEDVNSMDIAGLDASTPKVVNAFIEGKL